MDLLLYQPLMVSLLQYDVDLIHDIEELIGKKLEECQVEEDQVLKGITTVFLFPVWILLVSSVLSPFMLSWSRAVGYWLS
jgi:hypothetical protein